LSRANRTFELAADATHLAVHLLDEDDRPLAELFGGETGDDVDKLAAVAWKPGPGGAPLLEQLPRRFVGRVVERWEADADHLGIVLEPVEATTTTSASGPPLRLGEITDVDPGHEAEERR
jgi:flavin reductase (DIM6/NTAB) family NADH-FMN oxidoreductase RutF